LIQTGANKGNSESEEHVQNVTNNAAMQKNVAVDAVGTMETTTHKTAINATKCDIKIAVLTKLLN